MTSYGTSRGTSHGLHAKLEERWDLICTLAHFVWLVAESVAAAKRARVVSKWGFTGKTSVDTPIGIPTRLSHDGAVRTTPFSLGSQLGFVFTIASCHVMRRSCCLHVGGPLLGALHS